MLQTKSSSSKKNIILILVLITCLGVTGYFLFGSNNSSDSNIISSEIKSEMTVFPKLEEKINTELFSDDKFKSLKEYGDVPVKIGTLGKIDPFGLD